MNSQQGFEQRLRRAPLRQPSAEVESELLWRAERLTRSRRRWRQMTVAVVAAAALLLMVNVVAGQIHARNIATLTGQPTIGEPLRTTLIFAENLRARKQLITNSLEQNDNGSAQFDTLGAPAPARRPAVTKPLQMKPITIEALRARNQLINDILELNGDTAIRDKEDRHGKHNSSTHSFGLHNPQILPQACMRILRACSCVWRGVGR